MFHRRRSCIAVTISLVLLTSLMPPAALAGPGSSDAPRRSTQPLAGAVSAEATDTTEPTTSTPPGDATPTPAPVRVQDDNPKVWFAGKWTFLTGGWSGGTARVSRTNGAAVSAAFDGSGVTWVSQVGPDHGKARVYLDGVATATVSLYSTAHAVGQAVWSASDLTPARHTLRIVVLGSKVASSTGTHVHLDALDVQGALASQGTLPGVRVQNGDKRLYHKGDWYKVKRDSAYGGSVARTIAKGAAVTVRFKGTGVTWLGRKSDKCGEAEVWLDGNKVRTVSQYASPTADPRVVWAVSGLADGVHTVTFKSTHVAAVDVAGAGTGTELDAFQVKGTVLTALRPTPFNYPWKTYIVIDKSQFKLYWVKNGWLIKSYPIAHGKSSTPTPSRVWRIDAKYYTSPGSVYGPRKMRLFQRVSTSSGYSYVYTAYAIHGTNEPWVIGTKASHGCIRMYNTNVLELFPQVPLGTMVVTRD